MENPVTAVAITSRGIEDATQDELRESGASRIQARKRAVIFEVKNSKELATVAYTSQTAERILFHLAHFTFENLEQDLKEHIGKIANIQEFLKEAKTFRASCQRRGEHAFTSQKMEEMLGDLISDFIKERHGITLSVNLSNPDIIFYLSITENEAVLGIDLTGFDASKRDYKIFITPTSMKGTIASALLRYAGYGKKHVLLDPFVNDGAIVIEAALHASAKPAHFYQKAKFALLRLQPFGEMEILKEFEAIDAKIRKEKIPITGFDAAFQNVDYARKNAKIAGVEKRIYLSRVESEWLDIKFGEKSVDRIVTKVPEQSRKIIHKDIGKLHNEFFYQAEYILRDQGKIAMLCRDISSLERHYKKYGFIIEKQKDIYTGEQKMVMAVLVKGKKKEADE